MKNRILNKVLFLVLAAVPFLTATAAWLPADTLKPDNTWQTPPEEIM